MNDSEHPVEFTASGSEYFRIWIVNLALTIVTIGIYSAWAKVRKMKYFYRSTQVAGSVFDYHGSPLAILKGRMIAMVLVAAWSGLGYFSPTVAIVIVLAIAGLVPFLIQRSFRFKLYQSSYRGIRFHFKGSLGGAYRVVLVPVAFLLLPVAVALVFGPDSPGELPSLSFVILFGIAVLAIGALLPWAHHRLKRYQHDHSAFGTTDSAFAVAVGAFYGLYFRTIGLQLLLTIAFVATVTVGGIAATALLGNGPGGPGLFLVGMIASVLFYLSLLGVMAFFNARLQNTVWNGTTIGDLSFRSDVEAIPLTRIYLRNAVLVLITLGLYTPFAVVNTMRYRLQSMTVVAPQGLDAFMADARPGEESATGEGAVDLFDIDIAL